MMVTIGALYLQYGDVDAVRRDTHRHRAGRGAVC